MCLFGSTCSLHVNSLLNTCAKNGSAYSTTFELFNAEIRFRNNHNNNNNNNYIFNGQLQSFF